MKNIQYVILTLIYNFLAIQSTWAESTIVGDFSYSDIRNGNFNIDSIPKMINGAINFAMGIAGTIAIIFIIIGAYNIMLGDIATEKSKGKEIIMKAIGGFAIAALAWVIIKLIVDNLG